MSDAFLARYHQDLGGRQQRVQMRAMAMVELEKVHCSFQPDVTNSGGASRTASVWEALCNHGKRSDEKHIDRQRVRILEVLENEKQACAFIPTRGRALNRESKSTKGKKGMWRSSSAPGKLNTRTSTDIYGQLFREKVWEPIRWGTPEGQSPLADPGRPLCPPPEKSASCEPRNLHARSFPRHEKLEEKRQARLKAQLEEEAKLCPFKPNFKQTLKEVLYRPEQKKPRKRHLPLKHERCQLVEPLFHTVSKACSRDIDFANSFRIPELLLKDAPRKAAAPAVTQSV